MRTAQLATRLNSFQTLGVVGSILVIATLSIIAFGANLPFYPLQAFVLLAAVLCGALVIGFARSNRSGSVFSAFYITVLVFHIGLALVYILSPRLERVFTRTYLWYSNQDFVSSSYLAVFCFLLGMTAAAISQQWSSQALGETLKSAHTSPRVFYVSALGQIVPLALLSALVMIWIYMVKIALGIENYAQYNSVARTNAAANAILIFLYPAIAATFFFGSVASRSWKPAFAVYALWALIAFPMGMRGEVLFPLVMTAAVLMAQGKLKLKVIPLVLGSWALLWISSFGRIYRSGIWSLQESIAQASALTGLAELGGSLRPVYEVQRWLGNGIDHFRWGATYVAPFERTLLKFVPFVARADAASDTRLVNNLIDQRTDAQYGFSVVAEAMLNFGYLGTFIFGAFVGVFLLWYGRRASPKGVTLFSSAAVFGLFIHIRQGFVIGYGSAVAFLMAGFLMVLLDQTARAMRGPGR